MKDSVQTFLIIAIIFLGSVYMISTMVHYEKQIESLEYKIDQDSCLIDSLQLHLDSLNQRYEIFDSEPARDFIDILNAISQVESSGDSNAYNSKEDAVGLLQIRQCMVDDVNRILKRQGALHRYTYSDRWSVNKSYEMFDIYCNYYGFTTAEHMARGWNGGPRGIDKPSTIGYWNKVQNELNEINS